MTVFFFLEHLEVNNQTKGETDYALKAFLELSNVGGKVLIEKTETNHPTSQNITFYFDE